jgi:hypothetical protein
MTERPRVPERRIPEPEPGRPNRSERGRRARESPRRSEQIAEAEFVAEPRQTAPLRQRSAVREGPREHLLGDLDRGRGTSRERGDV